MKKCVVGIDEVGRGPLAGPVAVGVVVVPEGFDWSLLPGVTDSKQLTAEKREEIYKAARRLKAAGQLDYAVSMVSASVIDKKGIVTAINLAMSRSLKKLTVGDSCLLKLDGGLKAPANFQDQKTIIKGDAKVKEIGLASIVAKVERDRYMVRKSAPPIYAPYKWHENKGYGTKVHRKAIRKQGLTELHRVTFCRNII
ncbi:ribonuclease HII [bacterium]|nr:ribonuclease HII [bacterium]